MAESTALGQTGPSGRWSGFAFGLIAGMAMVVATVGVRVFWGTVTLTELAADWFTETLPPEAIDLLLETLSFSAKPLMFASLLVAQVLVGGGVGLAYSKVARGRLLGMRLELARTTGFALLLWLASMVTMAPAFGGGLFGASARGGAGTFLLSSGLTYVVYGLSLGYLLIWSRQPQPDRVTHSARRTLLKQAGRWALIVVVVGYGAKVLLDALRSQLTPSGAFRAQGALSPEITPNDEFYVVSKNITDPQVEVAGWNLEVAGLVEEPFTLNYEELRAMPAVEEFVTPECISNMVGGDLISNAGWKGVPLKAILDRAGLEPGVIDISFFAEDGYSESISLDRAMGDEVMVAYEMNGEPLSHKHGHPARLLVPGFFGLKSVKWLTKIEPVASDFQGYWQNRGWTDDPVVKTMSRFDTPVHGSKHPLAGATLGGVAFAGDRGISKVEISADEGTTWTEAQEISDPLSPHTWVIWRTQAQASQSGGAAFLVRATDGRGAVQTAARTGTLPDGATGHHHLRLVFTANSPDGKA